MKPTAVSSAKQNAGKPKEKDKRTLSFEQFKLGFNQSPQVNALVKHQYIELKLGQQKVQEISQDEMQIEDVFDDEPVRFSVKENGPKINVVKPCPH